MKSSSYIKYSKDNSDYKVGLAQFDLFHNYNVFKRGQISGSSVAYTECVLDDDVNRLTIKGIDIKRPLSVINKPKSKLVFKNDSFRYYLEIKNGDVDIIKPTFDATVFNNLSLYYCNNVHIDLNHKDKISSINGDSKFFVLNANSSCVSKIDFNAESLVINKLNKNSNLLLEGKNISLTDLRVCNKVAEIGKRKNTENAFISQGYIKSDKVIINSDNVNINNQVLESNDRFDINKSQNIQVVDSLLKGNINFKSNDTLFNKTSIVNTNNYNVNIDSQTLELLNTYIYGNNIDILADGLEIDSSALIGEQININVNLGNINLNEFKVISNNPIVINDNEFNTYNEQGFIVVTESDIIALRDKLLSNPKRLIK